MKIQTVPDASAGTAFHEADPAIADQEKKMVWLFEAKHSRVCDISQTRLLTSYSFLRAVSECIAPVKQCFVLYNGPTLTSFEDGIPRINAAGFPFISPMAVEDCPD